MTDILYAAISLMRLSLIKKSAKVVPESIELQCMNGQSQQSRSHSVGPTSRQQGLPGNPSVAPLVGITQQQQPPTPHSNPSVPQVLRETKEVQQQQKPLLQGLKGLALQEDEDVDFMVPLSPPRLVRQSGVYPYRRMKKKLAHIPSPAASLVMDTLQGRVTSAQGTAQWFSGGNLTTQNLINTGLTSSPECLTGLAVEALNNDGSSGNTLGRGRSVIHNWEVKYRWMNQSNCPVELELYTFRCVKPIPTQAPGGLTVASNLRSRIAMWYLAQVRSLSQLTSVNVFTTGMSLVR